MNKKTQADTIQLTKTQKENAVFAIKDYIEKNFDIEIGNLQSEFFFDYISQHIGVYFYNKGVADSMAFMSEKIDDFYLLMKDEEQ